jgi:hypothetical protein
LPNELLLGSGFSRLVAPRPGFAAPGGARVAPVDEACVVFVAALRRRRHLDAVAYGTYQKKATRQRMLRDDFHSTHWRQSPSAYCLRRFTPPHGDIRPRTLRLRHHAPSRSVTGAEARCGRCRANATKPELQPRVRQADPPRLRQSRAPTRGKPNALGRHFFFAPCLCSGATGTTSRSKK